MNDGWSGALHALETARSWHGYEVMVSGHVNSPLSSMFVHVAV